MWESEGERKVSPECNIIYCAHQVAKMQEQLTDKWFTLTQSTCYLAYANTYHCLCHHITSTLTPATSTLNICHINHIQEAINSSWNWMDNKLSDEYLWCRCKGHKVENCALIHICNLCCA